MSVTFKGEKNILRIEVLLKYRYSEQIPEVRALTRCQKMLAVPGHAYQCVRELDVLIRERNQLIIRPHNASGREFFGGVIPTVGENADGSGGLKAGDQNRRSGSRVQRVHKGRGGPARAESYYHGVCYYGLGYG